MVISAIKKTSQEMDRECLGGWGRGAASEEGALEPRSE